jgi:AcrR family transcriptional regulator
MAKKKDTQAIDISTEEKIKSAARIVFRKKGFAATRTRDIAEEAGINLALLHYYFRSKEKLFEITVGETMYYFFQTMIGSFNNENITFEKKIELFVTNYINMLTKEPDILPFIIGEMHNRPEELLKNIPIKQILKNSIFIRQYKEKVKKGEIKEPNPLHFIMNLMGITAMPFLAKTFISSAGVVNETLFNKMMQERKNKIPVWIKAMMKTS